MTFGPIAQWSVFTVFALISVGGALGMATTMSMYRSGILLMVSFMGVAGLFILLLADLLALLQVMMYIGGMLVMIIFMVMFSHDPGGAMMAGMQMSLPERFFTLGIEPMQMGGGDGHDAGGADDDDGGEADDDGQENSADDDGGGGMDMQGMSMTTPLKRPAALLALAAGAVLIAMLLRYADWPVVPAEPNPQSARRVGEMLMSKYMMAFEGAGLLILIGIFGAALLSRPGSHPDDSGRTGRAGVDDQPVPIRPEPMPPLLGEESYPPVEVPEAHKDEER